MLTPQAPGHVVPLTVSDTQPNGWRSLNFGRNTAWHNAGTIHPESIPMLDLVLMRGWVITTSACQTE